MAVCIPCAIKNNTTGTIPRDKPNHHIIGWIGRCYKCNKETMVYSNQEMGVNPQLKKRST